MKKTVFSVGGWAKLSTCDWPDHLVSTIFAQGCPWQCVYCHNTSLIDPHTEGSIHWNDVIEFMKDREGLLDGVVFSGGEPTRQPALVHAAMDIKDLGFVVGVHTSGIYPNRMLALVKQDALDWVGLDIKTALDKYEPVVGAVVNPQKIISTLDILQEFNVDTEIRTTLHPTYITKDDIESIVSLLKTRDISTWVLQPVRSEGTMINWDWENPKYDIIQYCIEQAFQHGIRTIVR